MPKLNVSELIAAEWLSRLVQIPSVTPSQSKNREDISGEARIAAALAEWFRALGGEVVLDEVQPGRPNVYGIWRGTSSRWIGMDVHLDTVGVSQMTSDPFCGEIRSGKVFGRGSADTKASLAIALSLLEAMQAEKRTPEANLLIVGTADEEIGGAGAVGFAKWLRQQDFKLDQLLVGEPTLCKPIIGHKGETRLRFTIHGKAAHSSRPQLGENAIEAGAVLIDALVKENQRLGGIAPHPMLGNGTLTVTLIEGGSGLNVVPDTCKISIDRRTLPGEDPREVSKQISDLALAASPLPTTVEEISLLNAFYQPVHTPWIQELQELTGEEAGSAPYGTNAFAYEGLAKECVVMGPGSIDQAHSAEEWIEVSELRKMSDIIQKWWGFE